MDEPNFQSSEYFINRELSWLAFNHRVLELAVDPSVPLLERLKFLCITSSNLDEFFEVRVARLKEEIRYQTTTTGPDGMSPTEQFKRISTVAHRFVAEQYRILMEELFPALEEEGIRFVKRADWTKSQKKWIKRYFLEEVFPVLTPIGIDPSHPFPKVLNKSLNFIIPLKGNDAFGREASTAILQAPRSLTRIVQLPNAIAKGDYDFVFLSSIIHAHVDDLFPGMEVGGCYQFRATRNSDLFVDEEETEDLRGALEYELFTRHYGSAVRLEVSEQCPSNFTNYLLEQFDLKADDCYQVDGPVNVNRLMAIPNLIDRPDLKYKSFSSSTTPKVTKNIPIFDSIRESDILLHHPFESFSTVIDFFRQASTDPNVLAIKLTLYRTDLNSALPQVLVDAARNGKEVTAVIELRARFDEKRNIELAHKLEEVGAHVTYGVVGYKTHAKMGLVVRKEDNQIRRYCHLGTGNYHAQTARVYTDLGLLTSDEEITEDVHSMFLELTGLGKPIRLNKIKQSPFTLHQTILDAIDREAENAKNGKKARIIAKMNSLTEMKVIQALYRASNAGVSIDLIIRGICSLRPGIPNASENIRVRSVVGRFLEHSRAFYFYNDGAEDVYIASADWMNRNLLRRVEQMVPILQEDVKKRIIEEVFETYLADNTQTWILEPDGKYRRRCATQEEEIFDAQGNLLKKTFDYIV